MTQVVNMYRHEHESAHLHQKAPIVLYLALTFATFMDIQLRHFEQRKYFIIMIQRIEPNQYLNSKSKLTWIYETNRTNFAFIRRCESTIFHL